MPINKEAGTPPPPMIGKIGPYTVFVTPPATPKPSEPLVESPMKKLSPIKTRVQSPTPSPPVQLPVQSPPPPPPPVQVPPSLYKIPAPDSGSSFGFFWNAVAKVQNAHSSLDDCVARWFGLNQSKYQWALDDYYESKGADPDAKPKEISTKTQSV